MGKSCPRFRALSSPLVISEKLSGWSLLARRPATLTSSKEMVVVVSESFACCSCAFMAVSPITQLKSKTVIFIRNNFTNNGVTILVRKNEY